MAEEFTFPAIQDMLIFLFLTITLIFFANILHLLIRRALDGRVSNGVSKTIARISQYTLILLGLWIGLTKILELDLGTFAASLGVLTLAIAFSSQQLIQNSIAGMLMSIRKVIHIDDWVEIGSTGLAQVKDITFTHTLLRTINGRKIYLANTSLLSSSLTNYTQSGVTAIEITFPLPGEQNYQALKKLLKEVAHDHPDILPNLSREESKEVKRIFKLPDIKALLGPQQKKKSFEPQVFYETVSFGRITLTARVWISDISQRDRIRDEFYEELFKRMKKKKLTIA